MNGAIDLHVRFRVEISNLAWKMIPRAWEAGSSELKIF